MNKLTEFKYTLADSLIGLGEINNLPQALTAAERMLSFIKSTELMTTGFNNRAIEKASRAVGINSNPELVLWIKTFTQEDLTPILTALYCRVNIEQGHKQ